MIIEERFTEWQTWEARNSLELMHAPGIYAIAVSEENLSGKQFEFREAIKYFGMTNSRNGLKGRLIQFDNTIKGKSGHGGADRFRYKHHDYTKLVSQLFVSIASFECNVQSCLADNLETMGDVAKFEYMCFAQYVRKFGQLPEFNNKERSMKYSLTFGREKRIQK